MESNHSHKSSTAALMLGAIGIVFGDIGTSVLYAMQSVFHFTQLPVTEANIYGFVSLFFWTLPLIVILGMLGAYIGCTIGIRMLKKHFVKAGMAEEV